MGLQSVAGLIQAKKTIKDGYDISPRKEQGNEDATTIATESSPDSKRSMPATTPQKQVWLQLAAT